MKKISGNKTGFGKPAKHKNSEKKSIYIDDGRPRLQQPRKEKIEQPLDNMRLGELLIDRMSHDGRGITYWNQKTCFVEGALTGEKVTARLMGNHSRYIDARVDQIVESSSDRIAPECQYYRVCGGCQLQHTTLRNQIEIKQSAVIDQIEAYTKIKIKKILEPIRSEPYGYRRSARLAIDERGNGFLMGFRQAASHELVSIEYCSVLVSELNVLVQPLHQLLSALSTKKSISHVDLIAGDRVVIVFRQMLGLVDSDIKKLAQFADGVNCEIYLQLDKTDNLKNLQLQSVDPRLFYSLSHCQLDIGFHPLDFIQINAAVNEKMIVQALDLLELKPDDSVLDLFCGIGNFTLPIAKKAKRVVGIEGQDVMVLRGRENAERLGISNVEFVAADLEKMGMPRMRQLCGDLDAVLLDPPRNGAKESVALIAKLQPKRVVYVSCNPATLARDAKELISAGYQLKSLGILDMFPQTAHVESMALFVR